VVKERNHQSVDWLNYFESIKTQCPWSLRAYTQGKIDIVIYEGNSQPLGVFHARMYVISAPDATVQAIADMWDRSDPDCEWLYSYPGYGEYATPVSVLIQQDRSTLKNLRTQLGVE
jgi:hypothetical protein